MIPMATFLRLLLTRLERTWQSDGQKGILGLWAWVVVMILKAKATTIADIPGDIAEMTAIRISAIAPNSTSVGVLIEVTLSVSTSLSTSLY